jgi:hypothetical protein
MNPEAFHVQVYSHAPTKSERPVDSWPDPIPFDAPARLPAFPLEDALPPAIAEFCSGVADSRQVSPDLPALVALGVLAAAAARRFRVSIKDDYVEPVNVYIAPALESGERKSATFRDCLDPLAEWERELQEREAPRVAAAREQRNINEARLEHLRRQAAKTDDPTERAALTAQAKAMAQGLTKVPAAPRLMVGDVTPEKLASILASQGGRIALADAESGGVFEILAGRYSGNGRANFDVFLRGHAGDDLRVDRMDRSEIVRHPALTVIIAPQPAVLRALADEPQFRGRGLLARFLYAFPQSLVGSRHFVQSAVQSRVTAAYREAVRGILRVEPPGGDEPGHLLRLSAEALEVWRKYHDETEDRQREGGDLRGIRDWASKSPGAAARVAGLLHLAEGRRQRTAISAETMAAAWAIVRDYLVPHAMEAFTMMATDRNVGQARKIAGWILRTGRQALTIRDAHKNFPAFGEPADFEASFRVLENRSIIKPATEEPRSGPGRKGSPAYLVNPGFPKLSAQSAQSDVGGNSANSADTSGGSVP